MNKWKKNEILITLADKIGELPPEMQSELNAKLEAINREKKQSDCPSFFINAVERVNKKSRERHAKQQNR